MSVPRAPIFSGWANRLQMRAELERLTAERRDLLAEIARLRDSLRKMGDDLRDALELTV